MYEKLRKKLIFYNTLLLLGVLLSACAALAVYEYHGGGGGQILARLLIVGLAGLGVILLVSWIVSECAVGMVREVLERQQRYLADASHELKTPLSIILTNAGILSEQPRSTLAEQMKWVHSISAEAGRMKRLVEDLLFLAKNEEAFVSSAPMRPVDVSALAEEALLTYETVAFDRRITLRKRLAPGLTVQGYDEQLRRLIVILLDNACKYTPAGGQARFALEALPNGARIVVGNTGDPIPPDYLERLFERFFRADKGSDGGNPETGYGLGLCIAKSIVDMHGGKIGVASTAQAGTVFTVILPHRKKG